MTERPNSAGSRADFRAKVSLGVELAALRGENLVSVELLRRQQPDEALLALGRARRSLRAIQSLGGANAQPEFIQLRRAIDDAIQTLRQPEQSGVATEVLAPAGKATLGIESKFVGDTSERPAYRASVGMLVFGAATGYDLAVRSDPIDPQGYRTAYGALREADNIHEGLAAAVEEHTNDHSRAADILFAAMFEAIPASAPPPSAGDTLEAELARLSNAIRSGAADPDVSLLAEESSELAADAAESQ